MRAEQMQVTQSTRTLLIEDSANFEQVKAFVRACFARRYAARVNDFLPQQLALVATNLSIQASMGYQHAVQGRLLLEAYLPEPVEVLITQACEKPVSRAGVFELGNLSAVYAGATRRLILTLAPYFAAQGGRWLTMTATREVHNIFARLGLVDLLIPLAPACEHQFAASRSHWGSYYVGQPQVYALDLLAALQIFEHNPLIRQRMAQLPAPARDRNLHLVCERAA